MTDSAKVAQEGLRGLLAVRHPNELRGGYTNIVMSPDKHDQKIIEAFKLGLGAAESAISTQKVAQEEKIVSEDPENLHDFGMSDGELDEVFIANASVHIERMDTTAFWIGIDAPGMAPLMLNTGVHRGIWYFNIQEDSLDDKAQFLSIQRPRNSKSIPVTKPESALSAQNEEMKGQELELRRMMWLGHGHRGIYGDDGEMQCSECARFGCWDYLRSPLEDVRKSYNAALADRLRAALAPEQGGKRE